VRATPFALDGSGNVGSQHQHQNSVLVTLWGKYDARDDRVAMRIGLPARAALAAVLPKRVLDRMPPPAEEEAAPMATPTEQQQRAPFVVAGRLGPGRRPPRRTRSLFRATVRSHGWKKVGRF
jgi:hypothetical protein